MVTKATYQSSSPKMKFIFDAYAMYHTPSQVHYMLEQSEEYKDETPALSTLKGYKVQYAEIIKTRRYEIGDSELPVIDPTWRFMRLQEIIEDSVEGIEKTNQRTGATWVEKDYASAIKALAEVNRMTGFNGKRDEDEKEEAAKLMKSILEELRSDLIKLGKYSTEEVDALIEEKRTQFASDLVQ